MDRLISAWAGISAVLNKIGGWLPALVLRVILFYEFFWPGIMKFQGENWFGSIKDDFPFPFSVIPVELSWFIATWSEILGGLALLIGLFTRFWSASLIILTIVAALGVHFPADWNSLSELWKGYAVSNKGFGNYKLPLLYLIMFVPLLFNGAGKASVDHFLHKAFAQRQ